VTLIVAIGCSDGVVLAADSAVSDAELGIKQPGEKLRRIGEHPILFGFSGDVGLLQKVEENLQKYKPKSTLKQLRAHIKGLVCEELQASAKWHVPYPHSVFEKPPPAIFLFAGVLDGRPWILEIERDGRDTVYGDDLGNFAAIGSGKPWAQAIFRPHLYTPRSLGVAQVMAYRVLDDSIALAAGWLASPIHIHTLDSAGDFNKLPPDDKNLSKICDMWREIERESLGKALAPPGEAEPEVSIPQPPPP
jgi:20S proteasome alpha/beta subunit